MGVEFSTEPDSPLKGWFDEVVESARAERRARDERIIQATARLLGYGWVHPGRFAAIIATAEEENNGQDS